MPTGYTAQLEKMEFDTKRWLTESVVRAFGMCVMLRDEGWNMSREEILAKIKKDSDDSYYTDALSKAKKDLKDAMKKPIKYWASEYAKALADAKERYEEDLKEKKEKSEKYTKVLNVCEGLLAKAVLMGLDNHAEIINPIKFAIEQINTCSSEWTVSDYYKKAVDDYENMSVKDFKKELMASMKKDVKYYGEELQKTKKISKERVDSFVAFTNFIKENIDKV